MNSKIFFTVLGVSIGVGIALYFRKTTQQKPQSQTTYNPSRLSELLKVFTEEFSLTPAILEKIRDNFVKEMREGLEENSQSSMKMIPTYITRLPTGDESGTAYALDIGGSNLRVLKVLLDGKGSAFLDSSTLQTAIPPEIQQSTAEILFNFIAENVGKVLRLEEQKFGFTFSFPIHQRSADSGYLITWTKGFSAPGVVGKDVVELLNRACEKNGIPAKINALINDTVGTMLSGAYQQVHSDCCMGMIIGTGANACYWEKIENIKKFDNTKEKAKGMIINMESGNFGARPSRIGLDLPLTRFDKILNKESNNLNQQLLEKQIAGMYLGEIFRLILSHLIQEENMFTHAHLDTFPKKYQLLTKDMSDMEEDKTHDLNIINEKLKSYGIAHSTFEERQFIYSIVHLIANRAADLAAAQIAACLKQMGKENKDTVVAIDGSVFEKYPGFSGMMEKTVKALGCRRVRLVLAKDGSGVGAALASYMMSRDDPKSNL